MYRTKGHAGVMECDSCPVLITVRSTRKPMRADLGEHNGLDVLRDGMLSPLGGAETTGEDTISLEMKRSGADLRGSSMMESFNPRHRPETDLRPG
jgi:hypothetical protein